MDDTRIASRATCRLRFIRFRRASKAVWLEVSLWLSLAVIYGIVSGHGMWYPINLLSAGFFPARTTIEQIAAFHWDALIDRRRRSTCVCFSARRSSRMARRFRCFRVAQFCWAA